MDFTQLVNSYGLYLASVIVGFSSALIPLINIEAYLLLLGVLLKDSRLYFLLFLLTLTHLSGKMLLYYIGRGSLKLNLFDLEKRIESAQAKYKMVRIGSLWTLLASALVGMPPFYVVTIVSGTMKIKVWQFFSIGFMGRLIRFSVILFLPQIVAGILK